MHQQHRDTGVRDVSHYPAAGDRIEVVEAQVVPYGSFAARTGRIERRWALIQPASVIAPIAPEGRESARKVGQALIISTSRAA